MNKKNLLCLFGFHTFKRLKTRTKFYTMTDAFFKCEKCGKYKSETIPCPDLTPEDING